ncbi:MAG: hypothetical protein N2510_09620 [Ignavibacteria bacterium]|nr:hypothetical protein [Ignavibacteria bacterium]
MKTIIPKRNFTNKEIISLLNQNGINCSESRRLIKGTNDGLSFWILNSGNEIHTDVKVPVWITILSLLLTVSIMSVILSLIFGNTVIVTGGIIVTVIGVLAGDLLYRRKKSEQFKGTLEIITKNLT